MSSVQYKNSILEEECAFHKQVEWIVEYGWNKEPLRSTSPEFRIGSHRYKLELSSDSFHWFNLLLCRKGPSVDGPSRFVRWWAGLKHVDGTYIDRNLKGELDLKEECETWTHITLHRISECELKDHIRFLRLGGVIFIVFFRLSLERPLTTRECTHGAAKMSARGTGAIREEECTSHKHVEWVVEFDKVRKRRNLTSPSFVIETRSYKLELSFGQGKLHKKTIHLHLYSKEPPDPSRSSRWWAGIKRSDGACLRVINGRGILDLKKESEIWTQKNLYIMKDEELRILSNGQKHRLVVFFRLNFERASGVPEMCNHVPAAMSFAKSHGTIREEDHSSYKHVEWEIPIKYSLFSGLTLLSPEFTFGSQHHKLEFYLCYPNPELNLYSRGPSVSPSRTARWWAGFRRSGETCILSTTSGIMDLQELCELWTQKCLYYVSDFDLDDNLLEVTEQFTFFFRMNVGEAPTATKVCTDGTTEMPGAQDKGAIQEVECASHKQVEWTTCFRANPEDRTTWRWSPAFVVGTQQFKFQLHLKRNEFSLLPYCLRLYSRGPSVAGPCQSLQWCMGLKHRTGTYLHKILKGELDPKEACHLWTLRGSIDFAIGELLGIEVYFFRLEKETTPMAAKACIHGPVEWLARGYGKIQRQVFPFHEQVEWTIDYRYLTSNLNFSQEFSIGTQRYILQLSQDSNTFDSVTLYRNDSVTLHLNRRGPSVAEPSRFVRWWAGLKRCNGTYHHSNQKGELDLIEECELWTQIFLHRVCRYELERELLTPDCSLSVFFRFNVERTATTCTHDGEEVLQKVRQPHEENSDVVFRVKDMKFRTPRAILEARIPAFKAKFHHDTVENTTSVVAIKDLKPAIFEEFLHYISTGFLRELTVHNVFAFYAIADKYQVDDLKAECLQCLSDTLSIDSFCDVVTLALRHCEDDLMKEATDFFSRNKNITTTDSWEKFSADNPAKAIDLLLKAFPPEEKEKQKVKKKKQKVKKNRK